MIYSIARPKVHFKYLLTIFLGGQRYRKMKNQKSRLGLAVTQNFAERRGLKPKVKK